MPPRGTPGANSRGRGGKFKKFTRGGGKHFSRDLRPLDADGNEVSMWSENAQKKKGGASDDDDDDDDSEEDSEEDSDEDSDDDSDAGPSQAQQEQTREERRAAKKAQKDAAVAKKQKGQIQVGDLPSDSEEEEEDDMPANPNHSKAARQQTRVAPPAVEAATEAVSKLSVNKSTMSRREREALEKQQAAERYRKLHAEGKTDEAKADMARLQQIREKREADAARKQAEKEEKDEVEKERRLEREAKESKKREAALGKPVKKGKK
ncbi:hypothetical protein E0Z10_g4319 [Xylaria hypoxylon]|uniref:Casein kinase substrate phosphoprotein PP28 domain-containing protein n=1 Tax=Xylaria hypoxylon TaxID=37992 RepID=A0A4Z0YKT2_9PEZI|nr:hypothetical protein E0Z10_g4319 [Xylaria hypoxylon]